jgi:glycosyltransferase involved in cell wall biosynthesis
MRVSVILSTYNQPRWLEKALWGYTCQTNRDFELVIADDGSGPETRALIDRFRSETWLRPVHVWHEDRGFRKTEILNRAILVAGGEYIIFSDGDCIPRDDFVATHVRLARPRHYLAGTLVRLSRELSERIDKDAIVSGRFADLEWLGEQGFQAGRQVTKLARRPWLNAVSDVLSNVRPTFDGGNASTWREGLIAVNGFDHEMKYGLEDRSLGARLTHIGYRPRRIRHRAIVLHLDHARPYATPEGIRRNEEIFSRIRRNREVRVRVGLEQMAAIMAAESGAGARERA